MGASQAGAERRMLCAPYSYMRGGRSILASCNALSRPRIFPCVADQDPELERLLKSERLAFERYERLRGYPADVQGAALALWTEATKAVREYRSTHP